MAGNSIFVRISARKLRNLECFQFTNAHVNAGARRMCFSQTRNGPGILDDLHECMDNPCLWVLVAPWNSLDHWLISQAARPSLSHQASVLHG